MTGDRLPLRLLLENLEREMRDLARRCRVLQMSTGQGSTGGVPSQMVVALQDLDQLTQILDDLAGLAAAASDWPLVRDTIDAGRVGAALRLESLAARLVAPPETGRAPEPDGFLL